MPEVWRRHDLLRVHPTAWSDWLRSRPSLMALPHLADWAKRGWPVIVRRRCESDDPALVPVGLPLPPSCGKQRIAAQFSPAAVVARLPPQTLRCARAAAPVAWNSAIQAVLAVADQVSVEPAIFGSLLWQWLTGLPYLSTTSDLDLLWRIADWDTAMILASRLAEVEADCSVHIDGELLLPDGSGVQYRELLNATDDVLVKADFGVELRPKAELFPGLSRVAA